MDNYLTPLGKEIQQNLTRLNWSQRELASRSNVARSAISRLMRGKAKPTPETIDAIAKTLNLEPLHLMRLAGIPLPPKNENLDSAALHIAQRITFLPLPLRKHAINATESLLNAIYLSDFYTQEELPIPPKIKELTGRIEAMAERYEDEEALEKALSLLGSQVEVLEMAASIR